jgi:DnaA family protein
MRQLPLALVAAPEPSFASFLVGENTQALAAMQALAASLCASPAPGSATPPPPLYLWGPPGSGKTHLLRALQGQVQAAGLGTAWFDAALPQPWAWSPSWRLVLIDGCEQLDAAAQQAAFALFIEAAAQGTQLVAAGRWPPVDLPLRDDLKTRLAWGPVLALQPPGDNETRAVLQQQARARSLPLPEDVLNYMLTRCERDLGYLMRLLETLDDHALAQGRHLTLPLLRSLLADPRLAPRPEGTAHPAPVSPPPTTPATA